MNPERPWPALDRLGEVTEARGFAIAPRLTIYPEFAWDPQRWIHESLRFAVQDRSDSEGLARDDPGAVFPERVAARPGTVGDGAEIVQIGNRSTQWYPGADASPMKIVRSGSSTSGLQRGEVHEVLQGVRSGQELGESEIITLFGARGPEVSRWRRWPTSCADARLVTT